MGDELTDISISNIHKAFSLPEGGKVDVLNGVSLELKGKRFTSMMGPNGCGKSTLLGIIAGITPADSGTVRFNKKKDNTPKVGYVWQDYRASLLPWLTAAQNVAFPLLLQGESKEMRLESAKKMIQDFLPGVDPEKPCFQLSGGQQQMLCLLRSAVGHPDLLLFDEPFSALDQNRRWSMSKYVEKIWQTTQAPALFVSHDVDEAVLLADDIILMGGDGRVRDVISNPLPRPRRENLLTDPTHLKCRDAVIEFLLSEDKHKTPKQE